MKQILLVITAALLLASCGSTNISDEEAKRKQLQQYKQELHALEQKIQNMEAELSEIRTEEVVNVNVRELNTQLFEHFIEVTGKVEAEYDVDISPETSGVIKEVYVREGDHISKGQLLAKLNTDILERSVDELKVQLELANTTFERQKNLWAQNIGSEMQYLQAKNNKEGLEKRIASLNAQIELAKVTSPVSGVVDMVYQKKGHIGSPQMPFAKVVNIEKIKIYADVSETYITKIEKGDKVMVNFPALNQQVDARINQISNTINPNNRTFRVRIDMNNPDKSIKPNLISIVKMRDYMNENAIVVPALLIKEDFKGSYTYISASNSGKTIAKKIYVKTGVTDNNMTEVVEGLEPGMQIITEGYSQVADGTSINI